MSRASMMLRRPAFLVLLGLIAGACASTPEGDAQALTGCWYFEQDDVVRQLGLPWGVRLTGDSLTGWPPLDRLPDTRVARTLKGPDETADYPFGYWRLMPGDSLRLGYPGSGGWVVDLAVTDDALVGTARPVGDAGLAQRPTRPVRLTFARCPG